MATKERCNSGTGIAGATYFMGFIAAVVFYIQNAVTFGTGVLGFFKAFIWPALLVYKLLEFFKM
jgi:hypothetical protein